MNEDLARRAVACKHWRWMPGMRAIDSDGQAVRVVQASGAAVLEDVGGAAYPMPSTPPDLDDPATLGCLLALVREAWNQPHAAAAMSGFGWGVYTFVTNGIVGDEPTITGRYDNGYYTEAEALVAALEAAP